MAELDNIIKVKLELEKEAMNDVRLLFKKMLNDNYKHIIKYGYPISALQYQQLWNDITLKNIDKVQMKIKSMEDFDGLDRFDKLRVNQELEESKLRSAAFYSNRITNTNGKQISRVFTASMEDINVDISNRELAELNDDLLRRKLSARIAVIANSFTQGPSEDTRQKVKVKRTNYKTWITTIDEKTRVPHLLANNQRVPIEEPFIVNGESLRFPGDVTMGATLKNTINCRCTVNYEL